MQTLSQVLFWVGLLSIPLSWLVWFFGPQLEIGRHVLAKVAGPALKEALQEAHAERWGIFVGLWPATLLVCELARLGKRWQEVWVQGETCSGRLLVKVERLRLSPFTRGTAQLARR